MERAFTLHSFGMRDAGLKIVQHLILHRRVNTRPTEKILIKRRPDISHAVKIGCKGAILIADSRDLAVTAALLLQVTKVG